MEDPRWGILIVFYLFFGGLSAGLFFVSALATYLQENGSPAYPRIAQFGALLAPWPVAIGCVLLVFDLGHWYRFYKLFVTFEWHSPMSIGACSLPASASSPWRRSGRGCRRTSSPGWWRACRDGCGSSG